VPPVLLAPVDVTLVRPSPEEIDFGRAGLELRPSPEEMDFVLDELRLRDSPSPEEIELLNDF
jgi:hypothetical protein